MERYALLIKVAVAVILGALAGGLLPPVLWGISLLQVYDLLGQLFLRALTLIVIPLVASSLIAGMMRFGSGEALGMLSAKIALCFVVGMGVAVAIGMGTILLFQVGSHPLVNSMVPAVNELGFFSKLQELLYRIVPNNILDAASKGEILSVIVFSAFLGFAGARLPKVLFDGVRSFWEGTFQCLLSMTQAVMSFLPIGVFGLIAKSFALMGGEMLSTLGLFTEAVFTGFGLFVFVFIPIVLLLCGIHPIRHFRAMLSALATACSTSSSAATYPVAMECLEKEAGVSNRICSFVLPLGITVNLCGSALYTAAVVTMIAQINGFSFDLSIGLFIYATILLTCFGIAGVPSASLVAIVMILQTLQLPSEQVALVMAIERFADMLRTPINVFATSCCAVIVARWEGEELLV